MSGLDSFFSKGFKAAKCKTLLKLTIPRIKLLRNRRGIQIKQMRRGIAKLLETGQEATARIRVEHIIREEKMMAAQEIVELFCELIAVRLPIIEAQRECPLDLKEAISSICFAAPRCGDLPELLHAQILFAGKYGKEFVSAATELVPECGVNRQLVELLSVGAPASDTKLKLLKEIAEEHELDWDPSSSEMVELLKSREEDLLDGPTQFVSSSSSNAPISLKAKHDETTSTTTSGPGIHEQQSDSDSDFEMIDLPDVPQKPPLQSSKVPEMLPFPASALSDFDDDEEEEEPHSSSVEPAAEEKQFVPFIIICPPPPPSHPSIKKIDHVDLHSILAAAQAAAESAERAAEAARSAASIAELRISEFVKKRNAQVEKIDLDQKDDNDLDTPSTSPSQNIPTSENDWDVQSSPYSSHQPQFAFNG